jgi:hypothetical protein
MSTYSDEPVLMKPDARRDWKRWAAAAAAILGTGLVVYVPFDKARKEEAAHHAPRGPRQGVLVNLTLDGAPHTLELTWIRGNFAPLLDPAPAAGSGLALHLSGRFGDETLTWNQELGVFGPTQALVDPYAHYKLSLRFEREGRTLWSDTVWAYGIHDTHGHSH